MYIVLETKLAKYLHPRSKWRGKLVVGRTALKRQSRGRHGRPLPLFPVFSCSPLENGKNSSLLLQVRESVCSGQLESQADV